MSTHGPRSHQVIDSEVRHMRFGRSGASTQPAALVYGRGAVVVDADGREYIDLFGGAGRCVLGHGDPDFARALADQAGDLIASRHPHSARAAYAHALAELTGLEHVSFFSTGSEAVDAAVRMACGFTGRDGVIVFDGAFHGRTSAVAHLTDPAWLGGVAAAPPNAGGGVTRLPYPTREAPLADLEAALRAGAAAVLIEPVQGTGGNRAVDIGFLTATAALAQRHNALLIFDEVLSGFGRTGSMFAFERVGVRPDILITGKGMANGIPVGGVLSSAGIAQSPPAGRPGALSSTFGGNPLTIAACVATLHSLQEHDYASRTRALGEMWLADLRSRFTGHPIVAGIHGTGLMLGIRLTRTLPGIEDAFLRHGLIVGANGPAIRLNPPYAITDAQTSTATDRIADALKDLAQ